MRENVLTKYKVCSKSIEIGACIYQDSNEQWIYFNSSFSIQHIYSSEFFLLVKAPLELFCWYGVKLHCSSSSNILHIIKSCLRWIFSLGNKKHLKGANSGEYGESCTCTFLCFTKKCSSKYTEIIFIIKQNGNDLSISGFPKRFCSRVTKLNSGESQAAISKGQKINNKILII